MRTVIRFIIKVVMFSCTLHSRNLLVSAEQPQGGYLR